MSNAPDLSPILAHIGEYLERNPPRAPEQSRALDPSNRVFEFEKHLKRLPQVELWIEHHFAGGVYCRELWIPRGVALTGHIHLREHLAVCVGDISLFDQSGLQRLTGFKILRSTPGVKRAGYAHEDTHFATFHRMENPDERDVERLEEEFVCVTPDEFTKFCESQKLMERAT